MGSKMCVRLINNGDTLGAKSGSLGHKASQILSFSPSLFLPASKANLLKKLLKKFLQTLSQLKE